MRSKKVNHPISKKSARPPSRTQVNTTIKSNLNRSFSGASKSGSPLANDLTEVMERINITFPDDSSSIETLYVEGSKTKRPTADEITAAFRNDARIFGAGVAMVHFRNCPIDSCSDIDLMFLSILADFGPKPAVVLAVRYQWQCQRPLQTLFEALKRHALAIQ